MNQRIEKEFEMNRKFYSELAEKRTIEMLGLTEKEIITAKAFETTKAVELSNIKNEIQQEQKKKLTLWSVLWRI